MRTMHTSQKRQSSNESGIVAILIVMIFTAILALISLGFSHLMNREARQSLDRQLSLQAYYSAESGLNDSLSYLLSGNVSPSNDCGPPTDVSPTPFVQGGDISGDGVAKYSCININPKPNYLLFTINPGESKVFKIDLANMANLYLSWENQNPPASTGSRQALGSYKNLPREDQLASPDATGLLRTGIYQIPRASGVISNANSVLTSMSRNYFMYPDSGSGGNFNSNNSVNFGTVSENGRFLHGNCSTTPANLPYNKAASRFCNSKIFNLNGNTNTYFVRLTAVYQPLRVSIQASSGLDSPLAITNVQSIVDVTGSGNDVLSRIQARIGVAGSPTVPNYGIQSMQTICKAFKLPVTAPKVYGQPSLENGIPNNDGICSIPSLGGDIGGGGGIPPLDDIPCGANATGTFPTCVCVSGYQGNPPATTCDPIPQPPPPPPPPPPPGLPPGVPITVCLFDDGSFTPNLANCFNFGGRRVPACQYPDSRGIVLGSCS